jgi:hypothetical protein
MFHYMVILFVLKSLLLRCQQKFTPESKTVHYIRKMKINKSVCEYANQKIPDLNRDMCIARLKDELCSSLLQANLFSS